MPKFWVDWVDCNVVERLCDHACGQTRFHTPIIERINRLDQSSYDQQLDRYMVKGECSNAGPNHGEATSKKVVQAPMLTLRMSALSSIVTIKALQFVHFGRFSTHVSRLHTTRL
jgi:hypothetical protein